MKNSQMKYSRGYQPRYYPRRRKKKNLRKSKIIFAWVLFLILIVSYVLFFSPIFRIKQINVSGNRVISSEEIQNFLANQNNIFLATNSKLKKILSQAFPRILSIKINKDIFKRSLELDIVERKEAGIFCQISENNDCYYIDKQGIIFEKAPKTSGALLLVIKNNAPRKIRLGKKIIESKMMADFIDLRKRLSAQLNLKALDFVIDLGISEDLKVNTNEGWYILFNMSRDFKNQLQALELVLNEKIKDRSNLEYIDLRIENRVYYK